MHASNGDSGDGQTALVCTNTGVAFTTFVYIIFYHTYLYFKAILFQDAHNQERTQKGTLAVEGSVDSAIDAPPNHPPTMTVIELRESLLLLVFFYLELRSTIV